MSEEKKTAPDWQKEKRNLITGYVQPIKSKMLTWEQRKENAEKNRRKREDNE